MESLVQETDTKLREVAEQVADSILNSLGNVSTSRLKLVYPKAMLKLKATSREAEASELTRVLDSMLRVLN